MFIALSFVVLLGAQRNDLAAGRGDSDRSGLDRMRIYECIRTSNPPKIDGRLDDACWKAAPVSDDFVRTLRDQDKPPSVQTYIRLLYDDQFLYVGVKCDEPRPEKIKATIVEDDNAAVCGDDCIEMFFHPDPQDKAYYQLAANSRAARYDGQAFDGSWNAEWRAAATVGKDAWYLECAISLKSFPRRKTIWRFNICRELRSTDPIEFHCWSDTCGAFHSPSRFGYLIFSGPFQNLRRGFLIQAAGYARSTLEKQQALEQQADEIRRMRRQLPPTVLKPFEKQLQALDRKEAAVVEKFSRMSEMSLSDWKALDDALGELLAEREKIFWKLKFHVLLND